MADQQWNPQRCLRLLRPLRAHLAALETEHQRKLELRRVARKKAKAPARKSVNDQSPDWIIRVAQRDKKYKSSKSYASESRSILNDRPQNATSTPLKGGVAMPSEFVANPEARVLTVLSDSNANIHEPRSPSVLPCNKHRSRAQIKSFRGVSTNDNVGGFCRAYFVIVEATKPRTGARTDAHAKIEHRPSGTPSLRSMAINAAAVWIERESLQKSNAKAPSITNFDDCIDLTDEVYNDFADLTTSRECGLPILAKLLRAHATRILCNGLRMRLLPVNAALSIVKTMGLDAVMEREMILESTAFAVRPSCTSNNCLRDTMVPQINEMLRIGKTFHSGSGSQRLTISRRILGQLAQSPAFPIDWLATPVYKDHWQSVLMDLTAHDAQYYNSRHFLLQLFRSACGAKKMSALQYQTLQSTSVLDYKNSCKEAQDCSACSHFGPRDPKNIRLAFTSSISSMLTILTSLLFVGWEEYSRNQSSNDRPQLRLSEVKSLIHELADDVLRASTEEWIQDKRHSLYYGRRCLAVLFCSLFVYSISNDSGQMIRQSQLDFMLSLDETLETWSDLEHGALDDLPSILADICNAASKISGTPVEEWLRSAIENLTVLDLSKRGKGFVQQICRETAEQMGIDMSKHFHSISLQVACFASSSLQCTPRKGNGPKFGQQHDISGWRWEPMLSEYVSATPVQAPLSKLFARRHPAIAPMGPPVALPSQAVQVIVPSRAVPPKIDSEKLCSKNISVIVEDSSAETEQSDVSSPEWDALKDRRCPVDQRNSSHHGATSSARDVTHKTATDFGICTNPSRRQIRLRQLSDFVLSSSPTHSPTNETSKQRLASPPPTPAALRPASGNGHRTSRSAQSKPAKTKRAAADSEGCFNQENSSEDELAPPKRRCVRLARKVTSRASTNRRSARSSIPVNYAYSHDISDDDLSI